MVSRFASTSVAVSLVTVIVALCVGLAASGCGSSQLPAAPGVETHAALEPTGPLDALHVSVGMSKPMSAFRDLLSANVSAAMEMRDVKTTTRAASWAPPSDTTARPVETAIADVRSRMRRDEQTMLLVVQELSHGLRAQEASASGWGQDETVTEHVLVFSAKLVNVQTGETSWTAEIVTRTPRLQSPEQRAEESSHQLTSALVRDGWIRPLLPASARR